MIGEMMVINSIVMTTCMSIFSNPLLDFDNVKICDLHKHTFLQILFILVYMR
jgi:hypothetical protein